MPSSLCHGSTDEACVTVCVCAGTCLITSSNSLSALKTPAEISEIAYPTQFLGSSAPWVSQVLDDSVIQIRRKRVRTGRSASRCTSLPPLPCVTSPLGNSTHKPSACLLSASSLPAQY